jgi:hypothetical protein
MINFFLVVVSYYWSMEMRTVARGGEGNDAATRENIVIRRKGVCVAVHNFTHRRCDADWANPSPRRHDTHNTKNKTNYRPHSD